MDNMVSIYCQEQCPIGKRCCFGEIYVDSFGEKPIRQRHKCEYPKGSGKKYVDTEVIKPVA